MEIMNAKDIEKALQQSNRNLQLPKRIDFVYSGSSNVLTMMFLTLQGCGLKAGNGKGCNMQSASAAFEGWAAALYVHFMRREGTVVLDVPQDAILPGGPYTKYPHYGRFLYRAMRFEEQYPWFRLSDKLSAAVGDFRDYLGQHTFVNNFARQEASDKSALESRIEGYFAGEYASALRRMLNRHGLPSDGCEIFRQLPVGLFEEKIDKNVAVFTGKSSAIDLWTVCGDTFVPIELKSLNRMTGALTELFFYTNYAYDMFVRQDGTFRMSHSAKGYRGYNRLYSTETPLRRVKGFLLLDPGSEHPLITKEVVDVLNAAAAPHISYGLLQYRWECTITEAL